MDGFGPQEGPERVFELKLQDGGSATWPGVSGEDAARRYVDVHREAVVVATREHQKPEVVSVRPDQIIG